MRLEIGDIISVSFRKEAVLRLFLGIVWASVLVGYSKGIINRLPLFGDFPEATQAAFVVLPLLLALPAIIEKLYLIDYLFYFVCILYYCSNYVFFPENSTYLDEEAFECFCCVYTFYFIGRLVDIDQSFNLILLFSTMCIFMDLFYFLIYAPGQKDMEEVAGADNMYRAYQSLPHVAMLLWATLDKFRLWKLLISFLGILFLVSCGTRGPLVCLGFFVFVYFLFYMNFKGAIYVKTAMVSLALVVFAFLREIALFFASFFVNLQLSTRILEKFITGELGNDSYRSVLRDRIYMVLDSGDHFWGLGLFGCKNYDIIYPHFLPLDFACTFGYLTGSILLLLLALLIGCAIWVTRGTKSQVFIMFLFSISIIKLMLSGTFVTEPYFFMLIGFCMKEIINRKPWLALSQPSA